MHEHGQVVVLLHLLHLLLFFQNVSVEAFLVYLIEPLGINEASADEAASGEVLELGRPEGEPSQIISVESRGIYVPWLSVEVDSAALFEQGFQLPLSSEILPDRKLKHISSSSEAREVDHYRRWLAKRLILPNFPAILQGFQFLEYAAVVFEVLGVLTSVSFEFPIVKPREVYHLLVELACYGCQPLVS